MWFSDFVLIHKSLGISDMVTIESQKSRKNRVEFNKPFACIAVRMEEAATALGEILNEKPSLVWLDYDGSLEKAMTGDIETAVGAMSSGSMLLVTVNAMVGQLWNKKMEDEELAPEAYLAAICDDTSLIQQRDRLTRNDFPALAAEIIHKRVKSAVLDKKPGCEYVPIWTYRYADDADMITVGGMVADAEDRTKFDASYATNLQFVTGDKIFDIELPVLTEKEKRALDKLLPSATALDPDTLEFELRPTELAAYQRFYLEYPIFNEMAS